MRKINIPNLVVSDFTLTRYRTRWTGGSSVHSKNTCSLKIQNLMKIQTIITTGIISSFSILPLVITSCDSNDSTTIVENNDTSHNFKAVDFVNNLNLNNNFDVTLVKADTLQPNFLVIYNSATDQFEAIIIDNYVLNSSSEETSTYYTENLSRGFQGLTFIPDFIIGDSQEDSYEDEDTGIIF